MTPLEPVRNGEPTACSRPRRDRGYTLVEMLIAVVLMGTIVLSIMGGMWAVVRASRMNDERAKVQAVLGAAGDQISNWGYIPCPEPPPDFVPDPNLPDLATPGYEQFGQKAASAVGWDVDSVQIVDYQYWNPETRTWSDTNTIQGADGTCNDNVNLTTSKTLQKLTIRATAPGGGYSAQIDIVKSNIGPKEVKDESAG